MDVLRARDPQQGAGEAVPGSLFRHKAAQPPVTHPEQVAISLLHREQQGGQGVHGYIGAYLFPLLPEGAVQPVPGGGEV